MSDTETSLKEKSEHPSDEKVKKLEDVEDDAPESERDMESKTEEKQEEKASDEESEEEESDDDEELPPGLLEQPLEVEGKRATKKVERLTGQDYQKEQTEFVVEKGPGVPLGEMEDIKFNLEKTKSADCKLVYYILFSRAGKLVNIKKHIRLFSGDPNGKESKENSKRTAYMNKLTMDQLKNTCKILNLHWVGKKSELMERIEEFVLNPQPSGKAPALASKKRKRSKTPAKKTKSKKEKSDKKKKKEEKQKEENESDDENQDESETPKAKKRKLSPEKSSKSSPKKTPKKKSEDSKKKTDKKKELKKKSTPKKEQRKKSTPKKKKSEEMSDLSSDSEDEPLSRLIDGGAPDNDEIREVVENILDGADLEAVTMKTVVKKVYAKYPKFDLSDRKDFIKDTVRQIIS